jgi:hypothetical protein
VFHGRSPFTLLWLQKNEGQPLTVTGNRDLE